MGDGRMTPSQRALATRLAILLQLHADPDHSADGRARSAQVFATSLRRVDPKVIRLAVSLFVISSLSRDLVRELLQLVGVETAENDDLTAYVSHLLPQPPAD